MSNADTNSARPITGRANNTGYRLLGIAVILAVAAFSMMLVLSADDANATDFVSNGINYSTTSETDVKVICGDYSGDITIPASVEYESKVYSVTAVGDGAFAGCLDVTSVSLPEGIATIGKNAFTSCIKMSSFTIPGSVMSIGDRIFRDCESLREIAVADGSTAFCSENGVLFSKDKTVLYRYPCLKEDASYAVPDGVKTLSDSAFQKCDRLKSVTLPDGLTYIDKSAFSMCHSLRDITVPDSVTVIQSGAFEKCTELRTFDMPGSLTYIGTDAFTQCLYLTSFRIPAGVTTIGALAFTECGSVREYIVEDGNTKYCSEDGVLFNKSKTELIKYPAAKQDTSYDIPGSVLMIDSEAFGYCNSLTSVTIPGSVMAIGPSAFIKCVSLTSVTIPGSIIIPFMVAFKGCTSLSAVTISPGVTAIGQYAFEDCVSLTSVTIPGSVTSIDSTAFRGCISLKEFIVEDANTKYCSENGVLFSKDKTDLIKYPTAKCDASYTVPDSVTTIGYGAFEWCRTLKSVIIPGSVATIEDYAFSECTSLSSVTIGEGVEWIGACAFGDCDSLTSVTIPASAYPVDEMAFSDCTSLKEIIVADGNENYCSEDGVLYSVGKIWIIQYPCGKEGSTYTLPSEVVYINYNAFFNCRFLKEILVADGNQEYCSVDGVLFSKDMTELIQYPCGKEGSAYTIPDTVVSLGNNAFNRISNLRTLTLGERTVCKAYSINFCPLLTSILVKDTNPYYSTSGDSLLSKDGKELILAPTGVKVYAVPNSVEVLGAGSLSSDKLEKLILSENVLTVRNHALQNCYNLKAIEIRGDATFFQMNSIVMREAEPRSITITAPEGTRIPLNAIDGNAVLTYEPLNEKEGETGFYAGIGALAVLSVAIAALPLMRPKK